MAQSAFFDLIPDRPLTISERSAVMIVMRLVEEKIAESTALRFDLVKRRDQIKQKMESAAINAFAKVWLEDANLDR
jgi:hypothetical protein